MNFDEMLEDVYKQIGTNKQDIVKLPPVSIKKETTQIVWKNVNLFLELTKTKPDHLFEFIKTNTKNDIMWFSGFVSDGLIIKNKFMKEKEITNLMIKYITDFVLCKICKKTDTEMFKDKDIKMMRIKCNGCGAEYTLT